MTRTLKPGPEARAPRTGRGLGTDRRPPTADRWLEQMHWIKTSWMALFLVSETFFFAVLILVYIAYCGARPRA
jgi:hypothetical protein